MKTNLLLISTNLVIAIFAINCYADNYYIGPWVWNYFEYEWEPPHQDILLGSLDLRSNTDCAIPVTPHGNALFVFSSTVSDPTLTYLGSDLSVPVAGPVVGPGLFMSISAGTVPVAGTGGSTITSSDLQTIFNLPNPLSATTYIADIWEILTTQADPTGIDRVKPLMPYGNNLGIMLGGKKLASKELIPFESPEWANVVQVLKNDYASIQNPETKRKVLGMFIEQYGMEITMAFPDDEWQKPTTQIWENWNCPNNGADVNCQQSSWPLVASKIRLASSHAEINATLASEALARCATDLSGSDMIASIFVATVSLKPGINNRGGVAVRFSNSAATTTYSDDLGFSAAGSTQAFFLKFVSGVSTIINQVAIGPVPGSYLTVQVQGSSMQGWVNGQLVHNFTDTAITGGVDAGICGKLGAAGVIKDVQLDNFYAADIPGRHKQWIGQ